MKACLDFPILTLTSSFVSPVVETMPPRQVKLMVIGAGCCRYVSYHSGTSIKRFPVQNISNITGRAALLKTHLVDIGSQFIQHDRQRRQDISENPEQSSSSLENDKILINSEPVLRLKPIINEDPTPSILGLWTPIADKSNAAGRLAVYGDSDCLSSTHLSSSRCQYDS
ncbi:unnamed protein product [Trichobilharzia regenti]|nr:unnamed protein product [Trichobilharzia regenti]